MSCQSQQSREGRPIGRATHSRTICNRRKAYIPPMVPCLVVKLSNEMQVLCHARQQRLCQLCAAMQQNTGKTLRRDHSETVT